MTRRLAPWQSAFLLIAGGYLAQPAKALKKQFGAEKVAASWAATNARARVGSAHPEMPITSRTIG